MIEKDKYSGVRNIGTIFDCTSLDLHIHTDNPDVIDRLFERNFPKQTKMEITLKNGNIKVENCDE